jgi:hypothetical protein
MAIMEVRGDTGADTRTHNGVGSAWFWVRVSEVEDDIDETDPEYRVTLVSPAGMDYDLVVRESAQEHDGGTGPNCNGGLQTITENGTTESASHKWDDDQGWGGENDSLWLAIEVLHVSGSDCNATWTLTVRGNP